MSPKLIRGMIVVAWMVAWIAAGTVAGFPCSVLFGGIGGLAAGWLGEDFIRFGKLVWTPTEAMYLRHPEWRPRDRS